ncbi:MAG: hypothetical protein RQ875_09490 [Vicingaceae bacterium]|nr:hypothetical protein [Vicingaceae bacterium]
MLQGKASKTELMRQFNGISLPAILEGDYPTVGKLSKMYGVEKLEKVIKVLVLDLSTAFEGELSKVADELAVEISTTHYNLTLEDVYLVFKQLKATPVYGKLTQNKVLAAINKHWEERIAAAEHINYNKHLAASTDYYERSNKTTEVAKHKAAFKEYFLTKKG